MPEHDWNAHYAAGETPWDVGVPDPHLMDLIRAGAIAPGRALEVGCGTGTNAVWLAEQGFEVLGVDLSPLAIEKARAKGTGHATCRFEVLDFLRGTPQGGPFAFVFDSGCFHVFDEADVRARFAERVAAVLAPGGLWFSIIGSTEGPPRDFGPPRRSARDVVTAIEPALEVVSLRSAHFDLPQFAPMKAWLSLARHR